MSNSMAWLLMAPAALDNAYGAVVGKRWRASAVVISQQQCALLTLRLCNTSLFCGKLRDYLAVGKILASFTKSGCPAAIDFRFASASTQLHANLLDATQRYGQQ